MKKRYDVPELEVLRLKAPALMLDVSRKNTEIDYGDSDKSKYFWGRTLFDDDFGDDSEEFD